MKFTTLTLSSGQKIEITEMKGHHLLQAYTNGGPESVMNPGLLGFHLAAVLCKIDGKKIDIEYMKELPICDAMAIVNMIAVQMNEINIKP